MSLSLLPSQFAVHVGSAGAVNFSEEPRKAPVRRVHRSQSIEPHVTKAPSAQSSTTSTNTTPPNRSSRESPIANPSFLHLPPTLFKQKNIMASPEVHHLLHSPIADHSFSADRQTLAVARENNVDVFQRSGSGYKLKDELTGHDKTVTGVDIAPNSGKIVTCSQGK